MASDYVIVDIRTGVNAEIYISGIVNNSKKRFLCTVTPLSRGWVPKHTDVYTESIFITFQNGRFYRIDTLMGVNLCDEENERIDFEQYYHNYMSSLIYMMVNASIAAMAKN